MDGYHENKTKDYLASFALSESFKGTPSLQNSSFCSQRFLRSQTTFIGSSTTDRMMPLRRILKNFQRHPNLMPKILREIIDQAPTDPPS